MYWLAHILDGSGDISQVTRRMVVMASENIGNADPLALQLALNATQAYKRPRAPEGEMPLAQAVTYLALVPKSNAAYAAWNQAKSFTATASGGSVMTIWVSPKQFIERNRQGTALSLLAAFAQRPSYP